MKHKATKNPDGSYTYREHIIKKQRLLGKKKESWTYQDVKSKLWHNSSTLKNGKKSIDRFIEFYNKINDLTEEKNC